VSSWERLKIGGGTPPILTRQGWLIIYQGVGEMEGPGNDVRLLCYLAGVMMLSEEHPSVIRYRSGEPLLTPLLPEERHRTIANVVFPKGIDRLDDLGSSDRFDVYYGMADYRIGVARLDFAGFLTVRSTRRPAGSKGVSARLRKFKILAHLREMSVLPDLRHFQDFSVEDCAICGWFYGARSNTGHFTRMTICSKIEPSAIMRHSDMPWMEKHNHVTVLTVDHRHDVSDDIIFNFDARSRLEPLGNKSGVTGG
jgi:hypothetical protein